MLAPCEYAFARLSECIIQVRSSSPSLPLRPIRHFLVPYCGLSLIACFFFCVPRAAFASNSAGTEGFATVDGLVNSIYLLDIILNFVTGTPIHTF